MFDLKNKYLDKGYPLSDILSATDFSICSVYHTIFQATPDQLVYMHDIIPNNPFISHWGNLRRRKQQIIYKRTKAKIKNRKWHNYIVHKKVLVQNKKADKYEYPHKCQ